MGHPHQGPARTRGGDRVPPLADSPETQEQATPEWDPAPIAWLGPPGADEIRCGTGLRVEGGDIRPWHEIPAGGGEGEGGGLGLCQELGHRGPLLGDRQWRDAQVRRLWTLTSVDEGWWDEFMDAKPYWE